MPTSKKSGAKQQNLVIVESPAKAKTIKQYLGTGYEVMSSYGHIRDLPKKGLNIDIADHFKPTYEISPDKKKVVAALRKAAKNSTAVWLASDEDREGEAIAWHLTEALGLNIKDTKRIVFHEITKPAIEYATQHPRTVDINLVNAQQARRLLDRLVGYELSPVLWKKVRPGLSAGRVQSVAVRLIVDREREIKEFEPDSSFKVTGVFMKDAHEVTAQLDKPLKDEAESNSYLETAKNGTFTVGDLDQKPGTRAPSAPFTTSSLQQEAARRLGFSVRQTMTLAQRLYENGLITYMRTDSNLMSSLAQTSAIQYIKNTYGDKYAQPRQYQTKTKGAQEAHEAIRPTSFSKESVNAEAGQQKLYKLIWQRALASQMANAEIKRTDLTINQSNSKHTYIAKGEVLVFDGFLKVYGNIKEDVILPPLKKGDRLMVKAISARESFSRPQPRYSEASLVKKLEELGIGRPSTYAPTISVIQSRGYVEKTDLEGNLRVIRVITLERGSINQSSEEETTGADRNKLIPTSVADVTTDFLAKYFKDVVDYDFTAKVEYDFDLIEEGKEKWEVVLEDFYKFFHPLVEKSEDVSREEVSQARILGKDPKSGKPIIARYGRYGPMLQRGETESDEKPDFAPLPEGVSLEEITLEQAIPMFSLPRVVGKTEKGEEIIADIGRFGPYIKVGKTFVSIKGLDPFNIAETEARKLYNEKLKQIAEKYIKEFPSGIKIANGPYGPYVTNGKKNARIAKDVDPTKLSEKEATDLLKQAKPSKRFKKSISK